MNIIESARALGAALQQDERYARYKAAKLANDNDIHLQKMLADFSAAKMELNAEMAADSKDTERITEINSRLNSLYSDITTNPNMVAFEEAHSEMDDVLQSINYIITCAANGEDPMTCPENPPACTGSCSGCSGCG